MVSSEVVQLGDRRALKLSLVEASHLAFRAHLEGDSSRLDSLTNSLLSCHHRPFFVAFARLLRSCGDNLRASDFAALGRDADWGRDFSDLLILLCDSSLSFVEDVFSYLDVASPNPFLRYAYSFIFSHHGDYARALEILESVPISLRDGRFWQQIGVYGTWSGNERVAFEGYRMALCASPGDYGLMTQWGLSALSFGRFELGWRLYEWRLRDSAQGNRYRFSTPVWNGRPFPGEVLFIYQDQGYGDMIQFLRYIPEVCRLARPGGRVIVGCRDGLLNLLRLFPDIDDVVYHNSQDTTPPPHDWQIPVFSLASVLDSSLNNMSIRSPYLDVSPHKLPARSLDKKGNRFLRVGLIWDCSVTGGYASLKRVPVDMLHHLGPVEGVHFYSLQFGRHENESVISESSLSFIDMSLCPSDLDFLDLARYMASMDIVISVDTAALHLAGSLGVRTYGLIPYPCDWRWMEGHYCEDWYPSVRLYRRLSGEDWGSVLRLIVSDLQEARFALH